MDALSLAQQLVAFESTSCLSNAAITDFVEDTLHNVAFVTERIEYADAAGLRKCNVVGKKGDGTGGLAYFAHTDVVPADDWFSDEHGPFTPTVVGDRLYGRGSCDMKGSIACMLAAAAEFSKSELKHPVYFTCTADEEVGYGGAMNVAARSQLFREMAAGGTRGIIGEPTMLDVVYAHKGTYGFRAVSRGRAAHSSTRDGRNANLAMIPFLAEMKALHDETESNAFWQNSEFEPPTVSWNIGINDHTRAVNITPPQSVCTVYYRPMPGVDGDALMERARRAAAECGIEFEETWRGQPLYVDPRSEFVREMAALAGRGDPRTVAYGTDGTMFTDLKQLVVFGPGDIGKAHTNDEWIALEQLERGTEMFARAIRRWCG